MRNRWIFWSVNLIFLVGCTPFLATLPDESATRQIPGGPVATEAPVVAQTKVNFAPASQEASLRVDMTGRKLIADNPQLGRPELIAIGGADPEIFHTGMKRLYVTEGLVKQCSTEGLLAAALANEMGRMVSEREAATSDDVRNPEPLLPIRVAPGGINNSRDVDANSLAELARFQKQFPKQPRKLAPPNPQMVARSILEHAGFQVTELDNALPILQNADRYTALQSQVKGGVRQADWKTPTP